jgi:hypothetical protein
MTDRGMDKVGRLGMVVAVAFAALMVGASACDKVDDIIDEFGRRHDAGATTGTCKTDTDCRTFADLCAGCDCRALTTSAPDPVCGGPGVQCLVDPCLNKTAVCQAGRCAISVGETCGKATCGAGTVCCNASCGICTPPGAGCTKQFCP